MQKNIDDFPYLNMITLIHSPKIRKKSRCQSTKLQHQKSWWIYPDKVLAQYVYTKASTKSFLNSLHVNEGQAQYTETFQKALTIDNRNIENNTENL